MKILVTGGAGFIGSHLCERLHKDGHEVVSLDNYFTGSKNNHINGVKYVEGHTKNINEIFATEKFNLIYHLGEYSRVRHALLEPDVVYDLNVHGTHHMLQYWKKLNTENHVCKLVYAGSSTKFADTENTKDNLAGHNLSPYTAAKYYNSMMVQNYATWYNLPFAITYFYNVYGPRELGNEYGTIVEIFRQNYLNNRPHKVNEPGTQGRNFTHVYDTVEALVLIGLHGEGDEHGIAADEFVTLLELAAMYGGPVEMHPQTKSSRSQASVKNDKIKKLGWEQKHTLKDYIESIKKAKNSSL
jgi:UDP-glucose 4-epimerase